MIESVVDEVWIDMDLKFLALLAGLLILLVGPAVIGAFPLGFLLAAVVGAIWWLSDAVRRH